VLATVCTVGAGVVAIDVTEPYSSGEIVYELGSPATSSRLDTLAFNCGLTLKGIWYYSPIPEDPDVYGAVVFLQRDLGRFHYRSDTLLSRAEAGVCWNVYSEHTVTCSNPDTSWASADRFPVSTAPLDTVLPLSYYDEERDTLVGRIAWANRRGTLDNPVCDRGQMLGNFNAIMYAVGDNGRRFKLQIAAGRMDSIGVCTYNGSPMPNEAVGAIFLRWAADSSGNGLFRESVHTRGHAGRGRSPSPILPAGRVVGYEYFTIRGEKLSLETRSRSHSLASGVLVRREAVGNGGSLSSGLLLKE
jgi:hypothetical protein